jgi:hypothetical protein
MKVMRCQESQAWWLTPVIPATKEAEIRRTAVSDQPKQKTSKTPPQPISQVPVMPVTSEAYR